MYKAQHFCLEEFLPPEVVNKYVPLYGEEFCWSFMDVRIVDFMDWLREELDRSITINNYKWGGSRRDSGYRTNLFSKKLYCSQHLHGRACDFLVEGMSVQEVHQWLRDNEERLPCAIWVENKKGMTWIHVDVRYSSKPQLYFFGV